MKIKLSLLFFLGTLLSIFAQNEDVYENWSSIKVDYELTKNVDIYGGGQLRIKSVGDSYNKSFYELGAKIKINDHLSSGFGFRGIDELDDVGNIQGHEKFNRYHAYIRKSLDYKNFNFRFRVQFQKKIQNKIDNPEYRNFWRLKLDSEYNIKNWKYDPRIGFEIFLRDEINFNENYEKYRVYFGTKFNLKKRKSLSIRYIMQKYLTNQNPTLHILRISYNYEIKKKKEKKTIS